MRMYLKRAIKGCAGIAAVAANRWSKHPAPETGCILTYHRVTELGFIDPKLDDWNVDPVRFERQLLALLDCTEIVPLAELLGRCSTASEGDRPLASLTFDDGYANFRTRVLPVLRRYRVPATVFVVTSLIDSSEPPPFDPWSMKYFKRAASDAWEPMSWADIDQCVQSGVVSIGAHSHRHLKANECSDEIFAEEAGRSMEILRARVGDVAAYAYPYGSRRLGFVPPSYVRAVADAGYTLAVTTDLGRVTPTTDSYLLPRVEAHGVDSPAVIRAKALGSLGPYRLTDRMRRAENVA